MRGKSMDPDVTVTVTDDEPETPTVVVVEAPDAPDTAADDVADAVGEGIAAGTAAVAEVIVAAQERAAVDESRFVTEDRLGELLAAALAEARPAEPETPAVVLEDDEIVPQYSHPWFRPLHEIRGSK